MQITRVIPQLRTTDLAASIAFYTKVLGFTLEFRHEDFYAGVRNGHYQLHLKLVDSTDPSIVFVAEEEHFHLYFQVPDIVTTAAELKRHGVRLIRDVHETAWSTRECIIEDNAGHTLYFGEPV
jgi:catechol 2,3-dioxygenase-like lactoylglutathione lyase family enzyme